MGEVAVEPRMGFIGSGKFSVNMDDILVIVKEAGLAALAAFLVYVLKNIGNIQMGEGTVVFLPIVTVMINSALKWVEDLQS